MELSLGNKKRSSMAKATSAWKLLSSKLMDSTRPTTTPALLTAALGLSPPMLSNLAVTR